MYSPQQPHTEATLYSPHFTDEKTGVCSGSWPEVPPLISKRIQVCLILKHIFTAGQYEFPSHLRFAHRLASCAHLFWSQRGTETKHQLHGSLIEEVSASQILFSSPFGLLLFWLICTHVFRVNYLSEKSVKYEWTNKKWLRPEYIHMESMSSCS